MTEISDLERRLSEALDRMRTSHAETREALKRALVRLAESEAESNVPAADDAAVVDALRREVEVLGQTVASGIDRVATLGEELAAEKARTLALGDALALEQEKVAMAITEAEADKADSPQSARTDTAAQASGRLMGLQAGAEAEQQQTRLTDLEMSVQQLQLVNAQLRQNNAALRRAHEAGLPDADLINEGLQAEIEALQAVRAADRAEIDSVLAALKTLVEETEDA